MRVIEIGTKGHHGWLATFELSQDDRLAIYDTLFDASGIRWRVAGAPVEDQDESWMCHRMPELKDGRVKLFLGLPGDVPEREFEPRLGDYRNPALIPDAIINLAVGWWLARLRGEDDIVSTLREHDVFAKLGDGPRQVLGAVKSSLVSHPIPDEKLSGFEKDLREWLQAYRMGGHEDARVLLWSDYGPCAPPLNDLAQKHQINGHRFPYKTRMGVYVDKVIVNGRRLDAPSVEG